MTPPFPGPTQWLAAYLAWPPHDGTSDGTPDGAATRDNRWTPVDAPRPDAHVGAPGRWWRIHGRHAWHLALTICGHIAGMLVAGAAIGTAGLDPDAASVLIFAISVPVTIHAARSLTGQLRRQRAYLRMLHDPSSGIPAVTTTLERFDPQGRLLDGERTRIHAWLLDPDTGVAIETQWWAAPALPTTRRQRERP